MDHKPMDPETENRLFWLGIIFVMAMVVGSAFL